MTAEGTELQFILDSVARLGTEVDEAEPGAPELAAVVATVIELQKRLRRVRSVMGPLIPDANRQPDLDEKTAANLERALSSLRRRAEARQSVG
jgi:hypothetical protein